MVLICIYTFFHMYIAYIYIYCIYIYILYIYIYIYIYIFSYTYKIQHVATLPLALGSSCMDHDDHDQGLECALRFLGIVAPLPGKTWPERLKRKVEPGHGCHHGEVVRHLWATSKNWSEVT